MSTQIQRQAAAAQLTARTEARRVQALASLASGDQAKFGQFFTPERAAALLASMAELPMTGTLRVLDPGAGSGSLTAAVVARVLCEAPTLNLELVVVEVDAAILPWLRATVDDIEETCREHRIEATVITINDDFVSLCTNPFDPQPAFAEGFDLVPMNPPYAKLNVSDDARRVMQANGVDCPNIYAVFMALGLDLLKPGGQLVSITPRSFANGSYFDQFRRYLLRRMAITRLHVFESRSTVFSDTGVLQENVILAGVRAGTPGKVALSISGDHTDEPLTRLVDHDEVVQPDDPHQFVRILTDVASSQVAERIAALPCTLKQLGIQVSTGRLVDFRSRACLVAADVEGSMPLIYPANLRSGVVEWPRTIAKAQGFKPQEPKDAKLLLPPGNYVVVKRFSSKEERRRVVACVWQLQQSSHPVAFENHINYFHSNNAGLDATLAVGLSLWLNSSLVDVFFRTFSGHTQVNVQDLKSLRYPDLSTLRRLGEGRQPSLPDQDEIDRVVAEALASMRVAA